jgi:NDP-sugar pyrophosphorylase family protein
MPDLKNMTAVILAGGLGTRLKSVVADRPKVLAEVHGRPFLAYLLDRLAAAAVRRTVLCTGHLGEQIHERFGAKFGNMTLIYSQESAPLGTAGALRLALSAVESPSALVLNGDSYCDVDLRAFADHHDALGSEATLVLARVPDSARFGQVDFEPDHRIRAFLEKGARPGAGWINAGVYLIARAAAETIPAGRAVSLEREVFPAWIGRRFYAFPSEGRFLDIGTPESYRQAEAFFTKERA